MSSYCFDINNPNSVEYDIEELKSFVTKLYIGKKKISLKRMKNFHLFLYIQKQIIIYV